MKREIDTTGPIKQLTSHPLYDELQEEACLSELLLCNGSMRHLSQLLGSFTDQLRKSIQPAHTPCLTTTLRTVTLQNGTGHSLALSVATSNSWDDSQH